MAHPNSLMMFEFIDDVRIITNISTGKLGATIADAFYEGGHQVIYLHGRRSDMPNNPVDSHMEYIEVTSAQSAFDAMKDIVANVKQKRIPIMEAIILFFVNIPEMKRVTALVKEVVVSCFTKYKRLNGLLRTKTDCRNSMKKCKSGLLKRWAMMNHMTLM